MSILQKPTFSIIMPKVIKISFLISDVDRYYTKTVDYIARTLQCQFITERSNVVYNNTQYNAQTMLIPSAYIKNDEGTTNLKNLLKLVCKHNQIICFLEFGSMQRVYDYRNLNK